MLNKVNDLGYKTLKKIIVFVVTNTFNIYIGNLSINEFRKKESSDGNLYQGRKENLMGIDKFCGCINPDNLVTKSIQGSQCI